MLLQKENCWHEWNWFTVLNIKENSKGARFTLSGDCKRCGAVGDGIIPVSEKLEIQKIYEQRKLIRNLPFTTITEYNV